MANERNHVANDANGGVLAQIESGLSSARWLPSLPPALRTEYRLQQIASQRAVTRIAMASFVVCFDLFLLTQAKSAPELLMLSAILRLGVLTPCVMAFIALDWMDRLGRLREPALLALGFMPILISAVLCMLTTSPNTLPDVRATPTILLAIGLMWRLPPATATLNAVISAGTLVIGVMLANPKAVPPAELPSLILIDIVMASTVIGFALQLERRDRRVFLLTTNERIRQDALSAVNRGLLRENQTDALTTVANRRCFDDTLTAAWLAGMRRGRPIALIMIDVDHFKKYNDFYGHQGGDECLRRVAVIARDQVRGNDMLARYGGEEFAAILPDGRLDDAAAVAERIRRVVEALAMPHAGIGPDGIVTISLGVASMLPDNPNGGGALVGAADANLYAAKRNGRNRVGIAPDEPRDAAARASTLVNEPIHLP